jgi:hypothetical protein
MLRYIPPGEITAEHIAALERSFAAAPAIEQPDLPATLASLLRGTYLLFGFADGLMLCTVVDRRGERRLRILAFTAKRLGHQIRLLRGDLRKLAGDWSCDVVETTCFSPRLTSAILRVGGKVESTTVILTAG